MREERALFILRACNNALLSYVAIFFLRIVFDPAASFFDPADLMVAFFAVCATVLDRMRPGMFLSIIAFAAMIFGVFISVGQYRGIPGAARVVICIIVMIVTGVDRITDQQFIRPELYEFLVFTFLYFVSYWINRPLLRPMTFIAQAVFFVLCVIELSITNMYRSLIGFHHRAAVPYSAIKRATASLTGLSVLVTLAVVIISGSVTFGPALWSLIKRGLIMLLKALFSLFPESEETQPDPAPSQEAMVGGDQMMMMVDKEDNPVFKAIWNALFAALAVVVLTFILWMLFKAVRDLIRRFAGSGRMARKIREYEGPKEIRERITGSRVRDIGSSPGISLSPDARIRRMYIRLIRGLPGSANIKNWESPMELEATALEPLRADTEQKEAGTEYRLPEGIRMLYEKARYAPRSCTADDVKRMKDLVRRAG